MISSFQRGYEVNVHYSTSLGSESRRKFESEAYCSSLRLVIERAEEVKTPAQPASKNTSLNYTI